MLDLTNCTLICLTNQKLPEHEYAIKKSSEGIKWGATKMVVDYDCTSIDIWNYKVIFELHRYVETDFAMFIHADGYVRNPGLWNPDWLNYDYIGAPWPLPRDDYSYLTPKGELVRVGNSVSLRSKRLLKFPSHLGLAWKSYYGNTNEDGFLCCHNRDILKQHGIRFAPLEVAVHFSKEHEIPENQGIETFAFHQTD